MTKKEKQARDKKYWINTVSRDHVMIGTKLGIVQAGHGKMAPLKRLEIGDQIIFYSPKTSLNEGEPLKKFTAIAEIIDNSIYQVEMVLGFKPYRVNAKYLKCQEVEIYPLIENLTFIENKKSWGFKFRFGLFEIPKIDFELITKLMLK